MPLNLNRITKRSLKIFAYVTGAILALLLVLHLWFINHAEQLIEELVDSSSNGKLKLEVRKFKFNWFSNKMELRDAVFYSTDTATSPVGYRFSVKKIRMEVKEVFPMIFEKRLLFDSLLLIEPDIVVTRLRPGRDTLLSSDTSLSLPQEMGRVYNSIQDALRVLEVNRFQIDKGKFSLINKIKPDEQPVTISNIYFHLDHLQVDTSRETTKNKILFSDNVVLSSSRQNILFPDGRHRLSFGNFHINLQQQTVEFDSCTIAAVKGDSIGTAFSIFFDKLKLINVQFDSLYHHEVIKADSVYCINPRFRLDADLKKRSEQSKPPPTLNELVQQMIGDMDLAYVSFQNGSFDINTIREGRPSSFTSDHNSFELQGLKVRQNAARPLVVQKFVMALHNYENFLRDSAYAIQFDSILINNDRISLSNFAYQELENNREVNSLIMPRFELRGLSWDDLVFNRQLSANNVTLYQPMINYNFTFNKNRKQDIFQALNEIGKILKLNDLNIVDGQINLLFRDNVSFQLQNANLAVLGKKLTSSRKYNSIRQSVTDLYFEKGYFQMGDISAELSNVEFAGTNNELKAETINLKSGDNMLVNAGDVAISSMIMDDNLHEVVVNGLNWQKADIRLNSFTGKETAENFILNNVKGSNTRFTIDNKGKTISGFLQHLSAEKMLSLKGKLSLTGLIADGNGFTITDSLFALNIGEMQLADLQPSSLNNITYKRRSSRNTTDISIPSITISPDINALLEGKIYADEIKIYRPDIRINISNAPVEETIAVWPEAMTGKLIIQQPQIYFTKTTADGKSTVEWKRISSDNYLELDELSVMHQSPTNIAAGRLNFLLSDFLYNNSNGKSFNAGKGRLEGSISHFTMQQNEIGNWDWQGNLDKLYAENFIIDSLGKKQGTLTIKSASLHDLSISSSLLLNVRDLVQHNTSFNLEKVSGSYYTNLDRFEWHNAGYNKKTRFFTANSFSFLPAIDKDAFISSHPYQADYIQLSTGPVSIGPVDIDKYISDTVLDAGTVQIHDIRFYNYRDRRLPIQPGIIRLLPVNSLKKISIPLSVDTLKLLNARMSYEELNEKTHLPGKIAITQLNGDFINVKNHRISAGDSLLINLSAFLEDSIFTVLHVKESYADTLGGFTLQLQINPANPAVLNATLKPLALVELKDGHIDTIMIEATGNDYAAYGKIKMIYSDFKVKLYAVKKGELVAPRLLNFLGNTIIKNKNREKESDIFFVRLKNRSTVNYLLKVALNGIMSTIGLKHNKKDLHKYQKGKS